MDQHSAVEGHSVRARGKLRGVSPVHGHNSTLQQFA